MSTSNHTPGTVFTECPACGGEIFDNRAKVESGEWNPKSPHFACRDKTNCNWASWPEREKKGGRGAARAKAAPSAARTVSGPITSGYSFMDLVVLHQACYKAVAYCKSDRVAAAATLFIACTNKGVGPPESLEDMPKALQQKPEPMPYDDDPGMEE